MPDISKSFRIWLPQVKDEIFYDIEIVDSDSVTHNVKANATNFDITWPTIRGGGLASFTLTLNNNERTYMDVFAKGNLVKFYFDYTDGTTLYKTFKMEGPKYGYQNGYKLFLHGRDYPELADKKKVVEDFSTGVVADECITRIKDNHFSGVFTVTGLASAMSAITVYAKYEHISGIKMIQRILERIGYDARIENDDDMTSFVDTGILSTTESLIIGQNIKSVSGFGAQTDDEKNRVFVIGNKVEECPVFKTRSDSSSIVATWTKDEIYKNTDIDTLIDAAEVATYMKDDKATLDDSGTVTAVGMATIKPGQLIMCSVPDCKIVGNYFVKEVKHAFNSSDGWRTELAINKTETLTSTFLKEESIRREDERDLDNPNNMSDTVLLFTFNNEDDIFSLSNLNVADGNLNLNSGISAGTMISDEVILDSNFTEYEIRGMHNDDMDLLEVYVSNNGGASYQQSGLADFNKLQTLTTIGKNARIKITLRSDADNPKPVLGSICLLVKY